MAAADSAPTLVLDTTVLLYAVGANHALRDSCQRIVRAVQHGAVTATTTVEVIQEFTHVRARRRDREDAAQLATAYLELLSPLLVVEAQDLRQGLQLFAPHPSLGSFDCVLAAATTAIGGSLVSADTAFANVPQLRHVVPDETSITKLLGPSGSTP